MRTCRRASVVLRLPSGGDAAYRRVAPDSPIGFDGRSGGSILDAYQGLYARAADGIREVGGFGEPELWRYDWERSYTGPHSGWPRSALFNAKPGSAAWAARNSASHWTTRSLVQ